MFFNNVSFLPISKKEKPKYIQFWVTRDQVKRHPSSPQFPYACSFLLVARRMREKNQNMVSFPAKIPADILAVVHIYMQR